MFAASAERVTSHATRNDAFENTAQAGPVRLIWHSIYPPLQPLGPGVEASAPLCDLQVPASNDTAPSRSSSRTSSSALSSFPATPCLPGTTMPQVMMASLEDVGQDNGQMPSGGWSTLPLFMLGSQMACHSNVATGITLPSLPDSQPSQIHDSSGTLYVSQSHPSQPCNYASSSCVATQASFCPPAGYTTVASNESLRDLTPNNLPELPTSFEFTFTAEPPTTYPSYPSTLEHEQLSHQFYQFSSDFGVPFDSHSQLHTNLHYTTPTVTHHGQNEFLDVAVQQEQSAMPFAGLETVSTLPDFTLEDFVNGSSTDIDTTWVDWVLTDTAPVQASSEHPPPDLPSHLEQSVGLPGAEPSTAPARPGTRHKRRRDEPECDAGMVKGTSKPPKTKRSKTTRGTKNLPLTDRRHNVRGQDKKLGKPCPECGQRVTPGRERHHRLTRYHLRVVKPKAADMPGPYECLLCKFHFLRKDSLLRHGIKVHGSKDPAIMVYYPERELALQKILDEKD
ncbi:hypothetical protein V8B97DRAFT_1410520 [Scleroderma yunnanense]